MEYKTYKPCNYLSSQISSEDGCSLSNAIGAKIGNATSKVVALYRTNDFIENSFELSTAVFYKLNIIIILVNDSLLKKITISTQSNHLGDSNMPEIVAVDSTKVKLLAESLGCTHYQIDSLNELNRRIEDASILSLPVIIELK